MAVPKKRTSSSRRGMRRAHDHINYSAAVESCPSCGEPKRRHHACDACGEYKGQQIIQIDG